MRIPIVVAAVLLTLTVAPASAQAPARDAARETAIEDQLTSIAPAAVPIFQSATRKLDEQDYAGASDLYRQVVVQAPTFTPALRRLGSTLIQTGQPQAGLELLNRAVAIERSPENLIALAQAIGFPEGDESASPPQREQALAYAKEATALRGTAEDASYPALVAMLALSLEKLPDARTALVSLQADHPDALLTHYVGAIVAAVDGEWQIAEREVLRARELGLPPEEVERVLASGVRTWARVWRSARLAGYGLVMCAAGLVVLVIAGRGLSAATLRSVEAPAADEQAQSSQLLLRRVYRGLIQTAGVYYYLSLPFVVILVIGGAAAVFYGFLLIGRIPVQLVAVLAIGAVVTVYRMVQSIFVKVDATDPGRSLEVTEAPGLWSLTRAVAEQVGTRVIDDIRVTPGTELAVYERGTRHERVQDQACRTLILGVGLLNGFRQGAFRAVLAHEYGHFAHRDTAGGDVALRVRQDMMKFTVAMVHHGQAVWWNPAFQFLRAYDFLFRRISDGAARLQEVMADRVAAQQYGAAPFEEGLRHVIRASIEFHAAANLEIQHALDGRRAVRNLYALDPPKSEDVERQVEEAISRPTTEDDSHPGPLDRFRLVGRVSGAAFDANPATVWELFADREALTREMTAAIDAQVQGAAADATP